VLPTGWKDRLIPVRGPGTRGATGYCLDIHDLAIAKYVANREKDRHFIKICIQHWMLNEATLRQRLSETSLPDERMRSVIEELITADFHS